MPRPPLKEIINLDGNPKLNEVVIITFKIPRGVLNKLDELSKRYKISRSEIIRNAVIRVLREHNLLEKPFQYSIEKIVERRRKRRQIQKTFISIEV